MTQLLKGCTNTIFCMSQGDHVPVEIFSIVSKSSFKIKTSLCPTTLGVITFFKNYTNFKHVIMTSCIFFNIFPKPYQVLQLDIIWPSKSTFRWLGLFYMICVLILKMKTYTFWKTILLWECKPHNVVTLFKIFPIMNHKSLDLDKVCPSSNLDPKIWDS